MPATGRERFPRPPASLSGGDSTHGQARGEGVIVTGPAGLCLPWAPPGAPPAGDLNELRGHLAVQGRIHVLDRLVPGELFAWNDADLNALSRIAVQVGARRSLLDAEERRWLDNLTRLQGRLRRFDPSSLSRGRFPCAERREAAVIHLGLECAGMLEELARDWIDWDDPACPACPAAAPDTTWESWERLISPTRYYVSRCNASPGERHRLIAGLRGDDTPPDVRFEASQPRRRPGPALRVLVVEDDPEICDLLSMILQQSGHEVLVAYDGARGYDAARRECPDVILMNLLMPVMCGISACRLLRADPRTSAIPVVISTASQRLTQGDAREAGALGVIYKPFSPQILKEAVQIAAGEPPQFP